jgi:hypothetical protein
MNDEKQVLPLNQQIGQTRTRKVSSYIDVFVKEHWMDEENFPLCYTVPILFLYCV